MIKPNIILITTDQQRYDGLSINGNDLLQTPHLDALAAKGTNFSNAYSTCPVCIPARRTLLTGLHPTSHGLTKYQDGLEFNPPFTLPGLLGDEGYQTQLIGKFHLHPQRKRFGFDNVILSETPWPKPYSKVHSENDYELWLKKQGVQTHGCLNGMGNNSRIGRPSHLDENLHHSSWLVQETVEFLNNKRDPSCPFYLHLSFWAPHPPLVPPAFYYDRYKDKKSNPIKSNWTPKNSKVPDGLSTESATGPFKEEELNSMQAGYYGLINHLDDCLSYLLLELNQSKYSDQPTYIIFSTDHGEMLGDHQLFRKSLPYEGSAHIPFFITSNNVSLPKNTSDQLVSLEDIPPTILDIAGVKIPEQMDGRSLWPVVNNTSENLNRDTLFGECGGGYSNQWLRHKSYKYIWFPETNEEQIFDLKLDPDEINDLSENLNIAEPLRKLMKNHLKDRTELTFEIKNLIPLNNKPPSVFWGK